MATRRLPRLLINKTSPIPCHFLFFVHINIYIITDFLLLYDLYTRLFISSFLFCYIFVRCSLHIIIIIITIFETFYAGDFFLFFSLSLNYRCFFSISGRLNYLNLVEVYKNFFFERIFFVSLPILDAIKLLMLFVFLSKSVPGQRVRASFFRVFCFFKFLIDYYFHYSTILLLL